MRNDIEQTFALSNFAAIKGGGAMPRPCTNGALKVPVVEKSSYDKLLPGVIAKLLNRLDVGKLFTATDAFGDRSRPQLRTHLNRCISIAVLAGVSSGCTTIFNPYLNSGPLNEGALCEQAGPLQRGTASDSGTPACSAVERFRAIRTGVMAVEQQAQNSYIERAKLNSISSALAFPAVGILLYRGVTVDTALGRDAVLQGAVAVGAAYEARNALLAGSPESIYILSEARLACVVDEAAKYRLDLPIGGAKDTCDRTADSLSSQAEQLAVLNGFNNIYLAPRDALITKVRDSVTAYKTTETTLWTAADHMQDAARKIVSKTNVQLKTPNISPATATSLMKSEMALFAPASPVASALSGGAKAEGGIEDSDISRQINNLAVMVNTFGRSCLRPQPVTPAAFDACTTYSPEVPPVPTITTTLPSNDVTLNPGETRTFIATSAPSGTPWAMFAGDGSVAQQALGQLQLITLSPTQTQVSLTYSKAVSADTKVVLSLTTIGVSGNATPITLTLKAATQPAAQTAAIQTDWSTVKSDSAALQKLGLAPGASDDAVKSALQTKWRALCGAKEATTPPDAKLIDSTFLSALKAGAQPDPAQPFCK